MKKEIGQCKDCGYWTGETLDECGSREMQDSLWTSYQMDGICIHNPDFGCWYWKAKT